METSSKQWSFWKEKGHVSITSTTLIKDSYLSIFEEYKKTRVAMFGKYEVWACLSLACNFFNLILLAAMLALHVLFYNNSKYSQGGRETYTYKNERHFLTGNVKYVV